jgi:hypothetical protein
LDPRRQHHISLSSLDWVGRDSANIRCLVDRRVCALVQFLETIRRPTMMLITENSWNKGRNTMIGVIAFSPSKKPFKTNLQTHQMCEQLCNATRQTQKVSLVYGLERPTAEDICPKLVVDELCAYRIKGTRLSVCEHAGRPNNTRDAGKLSSVRFRSKVNIHVRTCQGNSVSMKFLLNSTKPLPKSVQTIPSCNLGELPVDH